MAEKLTFDSLPKAINELIEEVGELKRLIQKKQIPTENSEPEQLLTVQQAADFLNLTVPTIYSKVSKGELPVMKRSKRLYFSRTELMDYLKLGRKKTQTEIEQAANKYLSKSLNRT